MDVEDDVTQRLNDAMNERRIDLGLKWTDVARRMDMSKETVLRFRSGSRTPETTRKIEQALSWPRGHIEAIVNGEPLPEPEQPEPEASSDLDQMLAMDAQWSRMIAEAEEMQRQLRALIATQKKLAHKQPAG